MIVRFSLILYRDQNARVNDIKVKWKYQLEFIFQGIGMRANTVWSIFFAGGWRPAESMFRME